MRVLILEDDPVQAAHLARTLEQQFADPDTAVTCFEFDDGVQAQRALRRESFDLLLLDWDVPGLDGIELLQWLRLWQGDSAPVPVLMLSSRTSEHDVAKSLNAGADDYIVKPFRPLELHARIQRLMARRRARQAASSLERFGRWEFDRISLSVLIHPDPPDAAPPVRQELSDREFKLALTLFQNIGRVLSRAHLLESVGYSGNELPSRTLDSHIYRLRSKLALEPRSGMSLRTVYGRGYCLEAPSPAPPC